MIGKRLGRIGFGIVLASIVVFSSPQPARSFAGEDFLEGNPWHHEAISEDALRTQGFGEAAVQEVAWNADYVDSYLYNPLWWIQGGLSRFKASLATTPELIKVHFDDNFSAAQVQRTWRRYLTGCMAGLIWAAEKNDIAAGRNVLGVSLHAIQDFYSHSNWIDAPERRDKTWFEFEKAARDRLAIYAGAYEHAEQTGIKPHGEILPACSVLKIDLLKPFLEPGCSAYSPLHNSRLCDLYDECKSGSPVQPGLYGQRIPANVLYASPPGMNLDARWSSNIGVRVRGLADIDGAKAFETARGLAQKASEQWIGRAMEKLEKLGFSSYVHQLKNAPDTTMKEKQFEEYHRFAYQFISAGPYPPDVRTPEEEWYLRVQTRTGSDRGAGTDADLYLEAAGKRFLLDYTPRSNPILGYNDFESGDVGVYTVGPFTALPERVTFYNDSAGGPEIARAIAQGAIDSVKRLADTVGDTLLGLVAGHADKIGTNRQFWTAEQLAAIPAAGRAFGVQINGGDEGQYRIDGKITKTAQSPAGAPNPWHEFRIQLTSLYCIREGNIDRLSPSEEPYLLALAVPFPGNILKYKTSPIADTDAGESKRLQYTFPTIRVPKSNGMISLPLSIWESDSESEQSRRAQLDKFADEASRKTQVARQSVLDAVGAATAADWQLASLTVYAFKRGGVLQSGTVLDRTVNQWIAGKSRASFPLAAGGLKTRGGVVAATIDVFASDESEPAPVVPSPNPPPSVGPLGAGLPLDLKHPLVLKPIRPIADAWLDYVEKEVQKAEAIAKSEFSGKRKNLGGYQESQGKMMDDAFVTGQFERALGYVKGARRELGYLKADAGPLEVHWKAINAFQSGCYALVEIANTMARLHTKAIGAEWYLDTYTTPFAQMREIQKQPEGPARKAAEDAFNAERAKVEDQLFLQYANEYRNSAIGLREARLRMLPNMTFFRTLVALQQFPDLPTFMSNKARLLEEYDKAIERIRDQGTGASEFPGTTHLYATFSTVRTVRVPDLETQTPRHFSYQKFVTGKLDDEAKEAVEMVRSGRFHPMAPPPAESLAVIAAGLRL